MLFSNDLKKKIYKILVAGTSVSVSCKQTKHFLLISIPFERRNLNNLVYREPPFKARCILDSQRYPSHLHLLKLYLCLQLSLFILEKGRLQKWYADLCCRGGYKWNCQKSKRWRSKNDEIFLVIIYTEVERVSLPLSF